MGSALRTIAKSRLTILSVYESGHKILVVLARDLLDLKLNTYWILKL